MRSAMADLHVTRDCCWLLILTASVLRYYPIPKSLSSSSTVHSLMKQWRRFVLNMLLSIVFGLMLQLYSVCGGWVSMWFIVSGPGVKFTACWIQCSKMLFSQVGIGRQENDQMYNSVGLLMLCLVKCIWAWTFFRMSAMLGIDCL